MSASCGKKESCDGCDRLRTCGQECKDACPVMDTVGRDVLFVQKTRTESCPFALNFGNSVVCTCPVHEKRYFN